MARHVLHRRRARAADPARHVDAAESPRWLAKIGRVGAANKALFRLGSAPVDENLPQERTDAARRIPILGLFAPAYRTRTVVVAALWFFTSLVSFGLATWVPSLYVQVFHVTIEQSLRYSALASAIYLFVPLLFAGVIDRVGRRWPAILSAGAAFASLVGLIAIDHSQTPLVVTLITTGWVAAAAGSIILWPYTAEIYPTHNRATGLGLSSSLARGGVDADAARRGRRAHGDGFGAHRLRAARDLLPDRDGGLASVHSRDGAQEPGRAGRRINPAPAARMASCVERAWHGHDSLVTQGNGDMTGTIGRPFG